MTGLLQRIRAGLRRIPLASYAYHRLLESVRPLAMAQTPYGFRIAGNAAMQAGNFEPEEVALVRALLEERDVLVDVGANLGLYSCLARSLGREALAVEPHPANQRLLRANLAANGWGDTEVAAVGLGAAPGEAELFGSDTGASLLAGWAGLPVRTLLRHKVRIDTLDALLEGRYAGRRLLIKVDIEGAEYGLLQGAARTLERSPAPAWMIEICLTENFPGGVNPDYLATFNALFSRGYRAFTANAARSPVSPEDVARWAAQRRADPGVHNYLFLR